MAGRTSLQKLSDLGSHQCHRFPRRTTKSSVFQQSIHGHRGNAHCDLPDERCPLWLISAAHFFDQIDLRFADDDLYLGFGAAFRNSVYNEMCIYHHGSVIRWWTYLENGHDLEYQCRFKCLVAAGASQCWSSRLPSMLTKCPWFQILDGRRWISSEMRHPDCSHFRHGDLQRLRQRGASRDSCVP